MNIFFIGPTCEINHTFLSHVASSEVNDSQPVGLGHLALNETPRNVLEIPSESTHLCHTFFFLFLDFFTLVGTLASFQSVCNYLFFLDFFRVGRHIGLFSIGIPSLLSCRCAIPRVS